MRPKKFTKKDIVELFYQEKILTKKQLTQTCGCSNMTAWRILSEHGYITSYNFNAKYYTLTDIAVFNSRCGLEKNELQQLLGVNVIPILSKLYHQGKLSREKVDSIFVYLQTNE